MTPVAIQIAAMVMMFRNMVLGDTTAALWYGGGGFFFAFGYIFLVSYFKDLENKRADEEQRKQYEDSKIS